MYIVMRGLLELIFIVFCSVTMLGCQLGLYKYWQCDSMKYLNLKKKKIGLTCMACQV